MRFLLYNIRYATGHGSRYHLPFPFTGFFKQTEGTLGQIVSFIRSVAPDVIALVELVIGKVGSCLHSIFVDKINYILHLFHFVRRVRRIAAVSPKETILFVIAVIVEMHGYDAVLGVAPDLFF